MDTSLSKYQVQLTDFEKDPDQMNEIQILAVKLSNWIQKSTNKKCIRYTYPNSLKSDDIAFKNEINNLLTANHPSIVPFLGFNIDGNVGHLFFESTPKGMLENSITDQSFTQNNNAFSETSKIIISYGIACAIEYLHSQKVVYEELKPTKIFLDSDFHPFLSLFHIKKFTSQDPSIECRVKVEDLTHVAPETFKESKISMKSDVYSYGILLYRIFTGLNPFPNSFTVVDLADDVVSGERPKIPSTVPENLKKLIEKCWSNNPVERPNFNEIRETLESFCENNEIDKNVFNSYKSIFK